MNQSPEKPHYAWNETIRTIVIAVVLAVTFRSLAFEPFHIPSGSMKSNLLVGDYLFVSKYRYGYSRYSFPFGFKWFDGRVLAMETPQRGDVAVFRFPQNPHIDYIKRVIGLPGDTIQMKDGVLYINGSAISKKFVDNWEDTENSEMRISVPRYEETLPEGKKVLVLDENKWSDGDNTEMFIVPEGHYFMMGDNRDNSRDSRFPEVRYVPIENFVGRAEIMFFSTDGSASLINPISWFTALRYSRLLKLI